MRLTDTEVSDIAEDEKSILGKLGKSSFGNKPTKLIPTINPIELDTLPPVPKGDAKPVDPIIDVDMTPQIKDYGSYIKSEVIKSWNFIH